MIQTSPNLNDPSSEPIFITVNFNDYRASEVHVPCARLMLTISTFCGNPQHKTVERKILLLNAGSQASIFHGCAITSVCTLNSVEKAHWSSGLYGQKIDVPLILMSYDWCTVQTSLGSSGWPQLLKPQPVGKDCTEEFRGAANKTLLAIDTTVIGPQSLFWSMDREYRSRCIWRWAEGSSHLISEVSNCREMNSEKPIHYKLDYVSHTLKVKVYSAPVTNNSPKN